MFDQQPTKRELYEAQVSKAVLIRQMLLLFGVTISIMLLMWAWTSVHDPRNFPINEVVIKGEFQFMNPDSLRAEVRKQARSGFFGVSVDQVRHSVLRLPWVANAKIRRVWPDQLDVEVEEHQPVSYWGNVALLNSDGEIFTPEKAAMPKHLAVLFGADRREKEVFQQYLKARKEVKRLKLEIVRFGMDERASWLVEFSNGLLLRLGQHEIEKRWANFMDTYPVLFAMNKERLVVIDMRFTNGMAVQLKPVVESEVAG